MIINLTLKEGVRFTVKLSVDLKPYGDAYKALIQARSNCKKLQEEQKANTKPVTDDEINEAKSELTRVSARFTQLRNEHIAALKYLPGEMHWVKIKELLRSQCTLTDPLEHKIYSALSAYTEDASTALTIECLDMSFIELLKNSMDAILINYFKGTSTCSELQMEIALVCAADTLSIVISDNAGGFSEGYLSYFSSMLHSVKTKLVDRLKEKSKHAFDEYCFGGSGLGHVVLANLLLRGELLTGLETYTPRYDIGEGSTAFCIKNNTHGAEVTLTSPIAPCSPVSLALEERTVDSPLTLDLPLVKDAAAEAGGEIVPKKGELGRAVRGPVVPRLHLAGLFKAHSAPGGLVSDGTSLLQKRRRIPEGDAGEEKIPPIGGRPRFG